MATCQGKTPKTLGVAAIHTTYLCLIWKMISFFLHLLRYSISTMFEECDYVQHRFCGIKHCSRHLLMCVNMSDSLRPPRLRCPWGFPGKNTGVGCHFLLQGILLAQGLNSCLLCFLHWQGNSLLLCHLGSPASNKNQPKSRWRQKGMRGCIQAGGGAEDTWRGDM